MKKYEYKVEQYISSIDLEDTLNEMAEAGWRCMSIVHSDDEDEYVIIFERLCRD